MKSNSKKAREAAEKEGYLKKKKKPKKTAKKRKYWSVNSSKRTKYKRIKGERKTVKSSNFEKEIILTPKEYDKAAERARKEKIKDQKRKK